MNFDPTTNRIPYGLLTQEEQAALHAWPHGVEYHSFLGNYWTDCFPLWNDDKVYRGKPAPKVTSYWFNIYDGDRIAGQFWSSQEAPTWLAKSNCGATMRIDICNGEVTVTKET